MQVATTPSFPDGLILVETAASGKTRTWHAQNLADAINKCNAAAIQARRGDESDEWDAVTDLAGLKSLLGRDLRSLDVYTVTDAADMIGAEAQGSALALGWIEEGQSLYEQNAAEFGTVNLPDGTKLALSQQAYVADDGTHYRASAQDDEGNGYRVTWQTTAAWDAAAAAVKAAQREASNAGRNDYDDPDSSGLLEDESNACNWSVYEVSPD